MKTIKANVGYNERSNKIYHRYYDVVDRIPKEGEAYGMYSSDGYDEVVTYVQEAYLDTEQPSDDIYGYSLYNVGTRWTDEDGEENEEIYYLAIKNEDE